MRENHTDVLVVGAGPVGLLTSLLLGQAGVHVHVIDKEANPASRSYACALHPGTLKLLSQARLLPDLLPRAHRINSLGLYENGVRSAEVRFSELPVEFPYVLILPQSEFEDLLEARVKELPTVDLAWNYRLSELREAADHALAAVDKLNLTVIGYSVPDFEVVVENTTNVRANYVVGADGSHSLVRRSLGIDCRRMGNAESFHVFEFESDGHSSDEVRVALSGTLASVMWPVSPTRCRWTFQVNSAGSLNEFPEKDRRFINVQETANEHDSRHQLMEFLETRAPWFQGRIGPVEWSTDIDFQHQLATQFGRNHCWLVGDAAHQTSPVGMHSMNMGLHEASRLAAALRAILRDGASTELLDEYNTDARAEWESMLGLLGAPKPSKAASPWVVEHRAILPEYLPASGPELGLALSQLGLSFN